MLSNANQGKQSSARAILWVAGAEHCQTLPPAYRFFSSKITNTDDILRHRKYKFAKLQAAILTDPRTTSIVLLVETSQNICGTYIYNWDRSLLLCGHIEGRDTGLPQWPAMV